MYDVRVGKPRAHIKSLNINVLKEWREVETLFALAEELLEE